MDEEFVEYLQTTLKVHFPEWLSGYCACGIAIPTYDMWIDHVMGELTHKEMKDGDSIQQDTGPI